MGDYEQEYIEYRLFLIGEPEVGKKSFIERVLKMPCTKTLYPEEPKKKTKTNPTEQNIPKSQSLPDIKATKESKNEKESKASPSKLYNLLKYKITIKTFEIYPAYELSFDFEPKFEDDSDYEIEKNHKMSFREMKQQISECLVSKELCIPLKNLNHYRVTLENLFIFIFDLSDYNSFEKIMLYYNILAKKFHLDEENSGITGVLIGNKIDKKLLFDLNQQKKFSNFLRLSGLNYYEISTRPYFTFEKFFQTLFLDLYGEYREHFKSEEFKNKLNIILSSKPTFAQSERKDMAIIDNVPGPGAYNLNLYSYNSKKEIEEALNNKKTKYKRKIFVNKSGPVFMKSRYEMYGGTSGILLNKNENNVKKDYFTMDMRECIDKPKPGFSLGILEGRLNLKKKRQEKKIEMNQEIQKSFDEYTSRLFNDKKKLFHDENYFKEALSRKNVYHEAMVKEKREKFEKLLQIHQKHLEHQKIQKEILSNNIFDNQKIHISKSASDIFDTSATDEANIKKQRYYDVIFANNKKHIEKVKEKKTNQVDKPTSKLYDIRGNLLNPKKGFTILGKRKNIESKNECPQFANIKSEFDIIAEKQIIQKRSFGERFKPLKKEEEGDDKIYEKKWQNYEINRAKSEREQNIKVFLEERNIRKKQQESRIKEIEEQKAEIIKYNKEILIKKGYDDGEEYKPIKYTFVEESSPSYSIKGRNFVKESYESKNRNLLGNSINYLNNELAESSFPVPNFNYPKPSLPAYSFEKAKRFTIEYNECDEEDRTKLFQNGKFVPDDHLDFSSKEPYSLRDPRGMHMIRNNYPGPGEYKIKSFAEEIIKEGKKKN